jgi:hypothetical protein
MYAFPYTYSALVRSHHIQRPLQENLRQRTCKGEPVTQGRGVRVAVASNDENGHIFRNLEGAGQLLFHTRV